MGDGEERNGAIGGVAGTGLAGAFGGVRESPYHTLTSFP